MNKPSRPDSCIGRYEVRCELGKGAMGIVLLARDPILERDVAIKFLRPDLHLDDSERDLLMQRMRQEARAIARVSHPGIVHLHDIGESPEDGVYLVFEKADGPTLEAALRRGRLTRDGVARLAREVGEGLGAAHTSGIVHRDVKPGNIILTEEGAKVTDFGVARLPESTLTKAGAPVGTPAYSAPEALRHGEHSAQSDQFSLAATTYEALCGRRPFDGADASTVAHQIENDAPLPIAKGLGLSSRVDDVLLRGLSKKPEARFPSCSAFGIALAEALTGNREIQPTLPDQRTLVEADQTKLSRQVGVAVLWLLVGATLTAGILRHLSKPTAAQEPVAPLNSPTEQNARPAYVSPAPGDLGR